MSRADVAAVDAYYQRNRSADYSCGSKIAYPTRNAARNAAGVASKDTGEPIQPYKCRRAGGGCGDWHIGHPPGWKYAHHRNEESTP